MKALLCKALGPPESLVFGEAPEPRAKPGEVVIRVSCCGINFPDVLIIEGKYQVLPDLPFSPGSEVAGTVLEVGEGVEGLAPGTRVMAAVRHGGLAEQVVVNANRAVALPAEMDFVTASGFPLVYGTSYHALKQRAALKPDETLLVLGAAGGVGLAAVEIGAAMGAHVIAGASTQAKLAVAREHGATEAIDYAEEDLRERLKDLTGDRGVDVVLDPVGGDLTEIALRRMAWNGRLLIVGFAGGSIPRIPMNLPLLKGCQIVGAYFSEFVRQEPEVARENFRELMDLYRRGALRPHVSEVYPFAEARTALRAVADRKAVGKLVVRVDES